MRKLIILFIGVCLSVGSAYGASWKDKSGIAEVTAPAGTEFIPVQITIGGVTTDHWIALDTLKTWAFADVSEIAGVTSTEVGFLDGVTAPIQEQINNIVAGSFAFDTYPTYEDSPHTGSGIAVNGTTLAVYSSTASKWLTVGLTDSLNPTPVPPTIGTWAIATTGATVTATLSETCVEGAGFAAGTWTLNCTETGPLDMGDPAGLPGTALTFTLVGGPVLSTATDTACEVFYTAGTNSIEDGTGDDLAGWATGVSVTNNSTETGGVAAFLSENFNESGLPSGWSVLSGTIYTDYTISPIEGTESVSLGAGSVLQSPTFTAVNEIWAMVRLRVTGTITTNESFFGMYNSASMRSAGTLRYNPYFGAWEFGVTTAWGGAVSKDTNYYLLHRYVAGTGANAVSTTWHSTDGTTWTQDAALTTGTATNGIDNFRIENDNASDIIVIDDINLYESDPR